jgi:hypothetical protein
LEYGHGIARNCAREPVGLDRWKKRKKKRIKNEDSHPFSIQEKGPQFGYEFPDMQLSKLSPDIPDIPDIPDMQCFVSICGD